MTTDEFGGVAVEEPPQLDAETRALKVKSRMTDEFGGVPVETDEFGGVAVPDLSGVKLTSAERDELAMGPSGRRESNSQTVPIALNPDYDFVRATHGDAMLAVPFSIAATIAGSKDPEAAPFTPLVKLPQVSKEDIAALPGWLKKPAVVANQINSTVEGFLTPEQIAQLPALELKAVQAMYLTHIAVQTPELLHNIRDAQTPEDRFEAQTQLGIHLGMAALMAKGVAGEALAARFKPYEPKGKSAAPGMPAEEGAIIPEGTSNAERRTLNVEGKAETESGDAEHSTLNIQPSTSNVTDAFGGIAVPEEIGGQKADVGEEAPPATPTLNIPGRQFLAKTLGLARRIADEWARKNILGTYQNQATGWKIEVGQRGISKALSGIRNFPREHLEAITAVPDLLKTAPLKETKPDRNLDPNIKAIHIFEAPLTIGEQNYRAKITVKETVDGKRFYDHSLLEPEGPAGISTDDVPKDSAPRGPQTGAEPEISAPAPEVKPSIPTERVQPGVPIQTFERPHDILDDIEVHAGGVRIPDEPDFDYVRSAFKELSQSKAADLGAAKLKALFRGSDPDRALKALHAEGLWRNVETPDDLFNRMIGAAHSRVEWAKQEKAAKNFKPAPENIESPSEDPDWSVGDVGPMDYVGMGGATPGEFILPKGTPTAIKNSLVDAERVKRGLPPALAPARRSFGDVWDRASAVLDENSKAADELIAELREKPRALTDTEDALLLQHQVGLQNDHAKLTREIAEAYEDGKEYPNRLDAVGDLRNRLAAVSDDLLDLYNINKAAGTETGRGLAARRMLAYEDYSLAKMELDKRAANGGRSLNESEQGEIKQLHERIAATQKAYDDYVAKTEAERAQRQAQDEINELVARVAKTPGYDRNVISLADRIVNALEGEATKARARLKEKFQRASSGVDPTILGDLAVVGAAKIARGALDITRWSKEMIADFGEEVAPWLNQAWEKSNARLDESVVRVAKGKTAIAVKRAVRKEDVTGQRESIIQGIRDFTAGHRPGATLNELGPYVRKLAENFVRSGMTDRNALIDAVHGVLTKEVDPNISRRQAMDAISGYGDFKPLDTDKVKVQLRELKGQMQQVAKLEDIQAKQPLQKTGLERRVPGDEERRLIQQVNEAKRRYGVVTTNAATQLKSALDGIKTRLRNQIKDLQFQISTKEKIVRGKTPVQFDAEAEKLQLQRDELKSKYDEIFTQPGLTDAQRVQNALRSVKASIDEYERRIAAKDISSKETKTPSTPELEAVRARRDALRAQFEELRDADESYQREQAARDLLLQKAGLEQSIRNKEQQLTAGPTPPEPRALNRPADPQIEQLLQRRETLNRQLAEARKKPEAQRYADELAKRLEGLQKRIAERQRQISTGDIQPRAQVASRPLPPALEIAKQQLEQLNRQLAELRNPARTQEEKALAGLKARLLSQIADYQERLAKRDFEPRTRRTIQPDAEAQRLRVEMERAKQAFQKALLTDRLKNRTWPVKAADAFLRWRRGFLLSSPVTLAKLTSAAAQRLAITPIEEAVGGVISKALPGLADRAPREGGLNVSAEAKALTEGFMRGLKDSWNQLREGESDLDVLYGRGREGAIGESDVQPASVIDFFGHLHSALKAPVKRAEFTRSFEKRMAWNMRRGVDVREPAVQTRIAVEAYKDANRSIFLQDNRVVSAYKAALARLEQPPKGTKQVPLGGKVAATALRTVLPIVRVPTNLVAETFSTAFGLVSGSTRLAFALRRGIETLPPEQADLIMRHLKKGSIGGAVMLVGFLVPDLVGGYYQPGQKRDKSDVPVGGLRVGGVTVPTYLLHNPLLETLQLGATVRRVADSKLRKKDAAPQGIPAGLAAGALGLTEEAPFVREMLEVTKAFEPHSRGAFAGELGKSIAIPQLVQWTAQRLDRDAGGDVNKRKPESILQHVQTGIPGLRNSVPLAPLPANPAVTRFLQKLKGGTPEQRSAIRQTLLRSVSTNAASSAHPPTQ